MISYQCARNYQITECYSVYFLYSHIHFFLQLLYFMWHLNISISMFMFISKYKYKHVYFKDLFSNFF